MQVASSEPTPPQGTGWANSVAFPIEASCIAINVRKPKTPLLCSLSNTAHEKKSHFMQVYTQQDNRTGVRKRSWAPKK